MRNDGYEPRPAKRESTRIIEPRGCAKKKAYWSESEAIAAKLYQESVRPCRLGVYHCNFCQCWHLTSRA